MFRPLSHNELRKIVTIQFRHIQDRLLEAGIRLEASDEVLDYLGDLGYDPQFGARPLKRVLQTRILNELSKEILAGNIRKDAVVEAVLMDDKIHFINIDIEIPLDRS
jgi:ATP-dependent Clp protease ATP-binding subunit ClpB